MRTKRNAEGYLMIDHSASPGVTDEDMRRANPELPAGAGSGMFETPMVCCSHCQKMLVVNPMRTRDRAYCRSCDAYICDECGIVATLHGECRPFRRVMDEAQERAARGLIVPNF